MTSQPGTQTMTMYVLLNISRSKRNQKMKFGRLIEYNMRNIFIENHTKIVVEKLFPHPFLKSRNWANLWINSLKLYSLFLLYAKLKAIETY